MVSLSDLSARYIQSAGGRALARILSEKSGKNIFLKGLSASSAPMLFAQVLDNQSLRCALFILDDQESAAYFYHDLVQIRGEENVLFFPSAYRRAAKYGQKDDASAILRTEVLSRLTSLDAGMPVLMVVASPDSLAETVVAKRCLDERSITLAKGQTVDRDSLQDRLLELGFERVDYVYEPGQFALRGSILDVFSFSSEHPFRIDFFGDDIDSMRRFSVESQLSMDPVDSVVIVPEMKADAMAGSVSLLEFLPSDSIVAVHDMLLAADRIDAISRDALDVDGMAARMRRIDAGKDAAVSVTDAGLPELPAMLDKENFLRKLMPFRIMEFGGASGQMSVGDTVNFDMTSQPLFHKNFDLVSQVLGDYIVKGYRLYLLTDNPKQGERLESIFAERGEHIPFETVGKTLHEGYADNTLKCCFFTDHQIFDRFHKYSLKSDRARGGKMALTLKELSEFQIGDYVVHIDHGVGRFGGLVRIPEAGGFQEKIKIIYRNDDVVFVSIHSLHKVSKYKGKEGEEPHINKLGTAAWDNLKEKTKGKIKDIARDLIKLYSRRMEEKGHAFSPDSYLQSELEASFIYEDTPDQLKATQDVKADMESSRPMDRLVCGDVGFGKTEVAIRAAFKAVCDSRQVAVLVPTTILAFQHYQTFRDRLKNFPCRVEYLSRARSAAQVTKILEDLEQGRIDIVVGTHKLISKQVKFKDLGLLIIDEEQKFGVGVKEKLKQMKVNVDTLTMTATPIPRTLQFSLMGARDLSVIQTPPPNRYPIQTEVHVFSADIIREAVNFEMSRNGQLFLISNRISSLPELAGIVQREVPDARVCIGHGQMDPDELEKIVTGFMNYDYDVLVATSIVENGIDIPNANTIIVNQAQNFGLSDLHQMRGRVGRSNRKAFCYLLAPPLGVLPQDARRRLQAIENFSDLGSGLQLALQDLDIRGAGNLLGAEQSGFIADLGYETYQKILKEAMRELKNDEFQDLEELKSQEKGGADASAYVDECTVESDLDMFFPESFVPNGSERILLYRELDGMEREEDIVRFKERLQDRFGKIPQSAMELIRVVSLRRMGRELGIEKIFLKGGRMSMFFVSNLDSPYYSGNVFGRVIAYAMDNPLSCRIREEAGKRSLLITGVPNIETAISILSKI
ncbi:MAG: transcription-repair coupling factor [Bacteroidaceae bacterium]|nr:transcription-repair coupling factor [Bacteroidaceae bacterium]